MCFEQSEKRPDISTPLIISLVFKSHNLLFNDVLKTIKAELNIKLFKYFNDVKSHITDLNLLLRIYDHHD